MSMRSICISKDCFPPASKCYNCLRKHFYFTSDDMTRKWKQTEFKRCSGCHLLSYCDQDCQMEHWSKVHKKHCKILSGTKLLANSKHSAESCGLCADVTTRAELLSANSSKAVCHIEQVIIDMKEGLGVEFEFHAEGKKGHCSQKFACKLPFPLGEVSGEFVDKNLGLDLMVAHALKILHAMALKDRQRSMFLKELLRNLYWTRINVWSDLMVYGVVTKGNPKLPLCDEVDGLGTIYGANNPWWKALAVTVDFIKNTLAQVKENFKDPRSMEDPRFKNLKLSYDYNQSQLNKKRIVSVRNMWSKFKLWPTLVNGSLVNLLPTGTQCYNCSEPLSGPFRFRGDDHGSLPSFFPDVGTNGDVFACCSEDKNPYCLQKCIETSAMLLAVAKEGQFMEEMKLFFSESRSCDFCLKLSLFSHRCSVCLAAQYCCTQCQHKDLGFHKTVCSSWAQDQFRQIISGGNQRRLHRAKLSKVQVNLK